MGAAEHVAAPVGDAFARALLGAAKDARPIPSDSCPRPALRDALELQLRGRALRLALGGRQVGWKVALTSTRTRRMLGAVEPACGYLLDEMVLPGGATLDGARLIAPRAEVEVAMRIARPLPLAGGPDALLLAAVEAIAPAIEIVDCRISGWEVTLAQAIADNMSGAYAVIGAWREPTALDVELATARARLSTAVLTGAPAVCAPDARTVAGRGAAVLGHPVRALAWLDRALRRHGERLRPGDLVLTGALAPPLPFEPGCRIDAEIDGLGAVTCTTSPRGGAA